MSFYLIAQNPELEAISWEGLKEQDDPHVNKLVKEKDIDEAKARAQLQTEVMDIKSNWTGRMNVIFFDPNRDLNTIVTLQISSE